MAESAPVYAVGDKVSGKHYYGAEFVAYVTGERYGEPGDEQYEVCSHEGVLVDGLLRPVTILGKEKQQ